MSEIEGNSKDAPSDNVRLEIGNTSVSENDVEEKKSEPLKIKTLADLIGLCREKGYQVYNDKPNVPEEDTIRMQALGHLGGNGKKHRRDDKDPNLTLRSGRFKSGHSSLKSGYLGTPSMPGSAMLKTDPSGERSDPSGELSGQTSALGSAFSRSQATSRMSSAQIATLVQFAHKDAEEVLQQRMRRRSKRRRENRSGTLDLMNHMSSSRDQSCSRLETTSNSNDHQGSENDSSANNSYVTDANSLSPATDTSNKMEPFANGSDNVVHSVFGGKSKRELDENEEIVKNSPDTNSSQDNKGDDKINSVGDKFGVSDHETEQERNINELNAISKQAHSPIEENRQVEEWTQQTSDRNSVEDKREGAEVEIEQTASNSSIGPQSGGSPTSNVRQGETKIENTQTTNCDTDSQLKQIEKNDGSDKVVDEVRIKDGNSILVLYKVREKSLIGLPNNSENVTWSKKNYENGNNSDDDKSAETTKRDKDVDNNANGFGADETPTQSDQKIEKISKTEEADDHSPSNLQNNDTIQINTTGTDDTHEDQGTHSNMESSSEAKSKSPNAAQKDTTESHGVKLDTEIYTESSVEIKVDKTRLKSEKMLSKEAQLILLVEQAKRVNQESSQEHLNVIELFAETRESLKKDLNTFKDEETKENAYEEKGRQEKESEECFSGNKFEEKNNTSVVRDKEQQEMHNENHREYKPPNPDPVEFREENTLETQPMTEPKHGTYSKQDGQETVEQPLESERAKPVCETDRVDKTSENQEESADVDDSKPDMPVSEKNVETSKYSVKKESEIDTTDNENNVSELEKARSECDKDESGEEKVAALLEVRSADSGGKGKTKTGTFELDGQEYYLEPNGRLVKSIKSNASKKVDTRWDSNHPMFKKLFKTNNLDNMQEIEQALKALRMSTFDTNDIPQDNVYIREAIRIFPQGFGRENSKTATAKRKSKKENSKTAELGSNKSKDNEITDINLSTKHTFKKIITIPSNVEDYSDESSSRKEESFTTKPTLNKHKIKKVNAMPSTLRTSGIVVRKKMDDDANTVNKSNGEMDTKRKDFVKASSDTTESSNNFRFEGKQPKVNRKKTKSPVSIKDNDAFEIDRAFLKENIDIMENSYAFVEVKKSIKQTRVKSAGKASSRKSYSPKFKFKSKDYWNTRNSASNRSKKRNEEGANLFDMDDISGERTQVCLNSSRKPRSGMPQSNNSRNSLASGRSEASISAAVEIVQSRTNFYTGLLTNRETSTPREHRVQKLFREIQRIRRNGAPMEDLAPALHESSRSLISDPNSGFVFVNYSKTRRCVSDQENSSELNKFLHGSFDYEVCSKVKTVNSNYRRREKAFDSLKHKMYINS